jgi:hypothetical protein
MHNSVEKLMKKRAYLNKKKYALNFMLRFKTIVTDTIYVSKKCMLVLNILLKAVCIVHRYFSKIRKIAIFVFNNSNPPFTHSRRFYYDQKLADRDKTAGSS